VPEWFGCSRTCEDPKPAEKEKEKESETHEPKEKEQIIKRHPHETDCQDEPNIKSAPQKALQDYSNKTETESHLYCVVERAREQQIVSGGHGPHLPLMARQCANRLQAGYVIDLGEK